MLKSDMLKKSTPNGTRSLRSPGEREIQKDKVKKKRHKSRTFSRRSKSQRRTTFCFENIEVNRLVTDKSPESIPTKLDKNVSSTRSTYSMRPTTKLEESERRRRRQPKTLIETELTTLEEVERSENDDESPGEVRQSRDRRRRGHRSHKLAVKRHKSSVV